VSGPVALHGGGEFLAGDEPFLAALLASAARRIADARPIRVVIVPTAAARGRPHLAAALGVAAIERVAKVEGLDVVAGAVAVIDAGSAADPGLAARLAEADLIHFPGGDPDLIPTIMLGSAAWTAIEAARARGALLVGASAGAMALAPWTWSVAGGLAGLGIVPGLIVVPHADRRTWAAALDRFGTWGPVELGGLGLGERTGVITEDVAPASGGISWRVVGPGEVFWQAVRSGPTVVARAGDTVETPAAT
jgi:cyanophycinase-like exopeptidase